MEPNQDLTSGDISTVAQRVMLVEKEWREKEEKLKEATYDQEMKKNNQSVRREEMELMSLENYPLTKLSEAGVISIAKLQELEGEQVRTFEQLVEWVNKKL